MRNSRLLTVFACLTLGLVLLFSVVGAQSALAVPDDDPADPVTETRIVSPEPDFDVENDPELQTLLAEFEIVRAQGPEAILSFTEGLTGKARDLLQDDIEAAQEVLWQPPVTGSAQSVAPEDEAIANWEAGVQAASQRERMLASQTDAQENTTPSTIPVSVQAVDSSDAVIRTVGTDCDYASIQAAVNAANPGDTLYVEGGVTFLENVSINKNLTIIGGNPDCASGSSQATIVDGSNTGRVFAIASTLNVTLDNLIIQNGSSIGEGGGIQFALGIGGGILNLNNVNVYTNTAQWGGGLWVGKGAELHGVGVNLADNVATAYGGGVRLFGATAYFTNTEIYDNTAINGAGVYASKKDEFYPMLDLSSYADIHHNQALTGDGHGGGLYLSEGTAMVADCSDLYENESLFGGGAYIITSTLTINGQCSDVSSNLAAADGAGVFALSSVLNLQDQTRLYLNIAQHNGGGAYLDNSELWGDYASIRYNSAEVHGGGVYATNDAEFDMDAGNFDCRLDKCSILANNAAGSYGGGAYATSGSEIDLRQTYVENNDANFGGALYTTGSGTGVYLYNTLLAKNDATSGTGDAIRLYTDSTMNAAHITVVDNGFSDGAHLGNAITLYSADLNLNNSIIWGHTWSIDSEGTSVVNASCSDIESGFDSGSDIIDVDPQFVSEVSGDYHLQDSSPAIDACLSTSGASPDIDNIIRPIVMSDPATPYDMGADEVGGWVGINDSGCVFGTIQEAINVAVAGDTIRAYAGTFTETLSVNKSLQIIGGYDDTCTTLTDSKTTVNGDDGSSAITTLYVYSDLIVMLENLTITGGQGNGAGVEVRENAQVTIDTTHITGNAGTTGGGVMIRAGAAVTLTDESYIGDNVASVAGGGVYVDGGTFNAIDTNSDIRENTAPHGGGIYAINNAVVLIDDSDMGGNVANDAVGQGGAIYASSSDVTLTGNAWVYADNTAYDGGGIYADASAISLESTVTVLQGNHASNNGGALYLANASTLNTVSGSDIGYHSSTNDQNTAVNGAGVYAVDSTLYIAGNVANNHAEDRGAGLYLDGGSVILDGATIGGTGLGEANMLTGASNRYGAGLFLRNGTQATLNNTDVIGNDFSDGFASCGGGISLSGGSVLTATDSTIALNNSLGTANGRGGGLYVEQSTATLNNCSVLTNTATMDGGGIRVYGNSTLTMNDTSVEDNVSGSGSGGGLAVLTGSPDINLNDVTFMDNIAASDGGAIYFGTDGTLDISGGMTFRDNEADGNGGAIAVLSAITVNFEADAYSLVYNNSAGGSGGFFQGADGVTLNLTSSTGVPVYIYANSAGADGGGIHMGSNANVSIAGAIRMDRNRADSGRGGAIALSPGSVLNMQPNAGESPQVWDNYADSGGGIYATGVDVTCNRVVFNDDTDGNHASSTDGGAIYLSGGTLDATNCIFNWNEAARHGGALALVDSTATITTDFNTCDALTSECSLFDGNIADSNADDDGDGGALYVENSDVTVANSIFRNNTAQQGGVYYHASGAGVVQNTLMYDNTAVAGVGAAMRSYGGTMILQHVTLANNINGAAYSHSNGDATINQSIAWGNDSGGFHLRSGTMTGTCNIDQEEQVGTNEDPFFSDAANGDYHLGEDSPAIDACDTGLATDLEATARPLGRGYDMGAYEALESAYLNFLPMSLKNAN